VTGTSDRGPVTRLSDNPAEPSSSLGSRLLRAHRMGPLVPLLLGGYALWAAYELSLGELTDPGPGLWPFIVAFVITLTAAILLVVDDPDDYERWTRGTAQIAGGLVSLGLFIVLFQVLGFLIPAVLMLLLWLKVFGEEPWRWAVPLAIGGAVLLHLVFVEALSVPFPRGALLSMAASTVAG
jgi:putative tricarboxylic transport membrane protein